MSLLRADVESFGSSDEVFRVSPSFDVKDRGLTAIGTHPRAGRVAAVVLCGIAAALCSVFVSVSVQPSYQPQIDLATHVQQRLQLHTAAQQHTAAQLQALPESSDGNAVPLWHGLSSGAGHNFESAHGTMRDLVARKEILASWGWKDRGAGLRSGGFVPHSQSSQLWDFPEIRRYQVQNNRETFWRNIEHMQDTHVGSLRWPDSVSSGFVWPTPDGTATTHTRPQMAKAGGLLHRGELMPMTRPNVQWSTSCSSSLCPLDTPHKERALAWQYCMNHFVTNAEKRYCFAAVLSPAKPPPSCPPYDDVPEHGSLRVNDGDDEGGKRVVTGGRIYIECDDGFEVVGPSWVECTPGALVYTKAGKCEAITCPPYTTPAHGSVTPASSVGYGEHVTVTCDDGYLGGGDAICGKGGYKGDVSCTKIKCPPYLPPSHAHVSPAGSVDSDQYVHIICDKGYVPQGEGSDLQCGPDGKYIGTPKQCVEVECAPYVAPEHGSADIPDSVRVGDHVTVTCDDGYEAVGETGEKVEQVVCGPDQHFSPGVVCRPVCPPFPSVPHGTVTPSGSIPEVGHVTVSCDEGYMVESGDGEAVCGKGHTYVPASVDCVKIPECPPYPAPKHGSVSPSGEYVPIGSQVRVYCDEGYVISSNSSDQPMCNGDGTYDYPTVTCVPVPFCAPYALPHGRVLSPPERANVGDQVEVECEPGYSLRRGGSSVVTCREDGTWDYEDECVPLPLCPALEPPEHSSIFHRGNVTLGSCVEVICDKGYDFDPEGGGKKMPCCYRDLISGIVKMQEPKKCLKPEQFCEICADITVCPHCFIGKKKFTGKRRDFHFD